MNIDCRVIGDLLPLYADESCSDASRALVDDHLKTCPRCRETLARMKSEQFLPAAQAIDPPAVADYAQKVKHRRQKRGTLLTVGVIVLMLTIFGAGIVRAASTYMGMAILVTAISIYVIGIFKSDSSIFSVLAADFETTGFMNMPKAILNAFTYAGFQCVTLPTMIACGTP